MATLPTQTGLFGNALARSEQESKKIPSGNISLQPLLSERENDQPLRSLDGEAGVPVQTTQATQPTTVPPVSPVIEPVTPVTQAPVTPVTEAPVTQAPVTQPVVEDKKGLFTPGNIPVEGITTDLPQTGLFTQLPTAPQPTAVAPQEATTFQQAEAVTPEAFTQEVGEEQLVSTQLNKLLQADSPFLEQARQMARRGAFRRGGAVGGSSIAESAAAGAAIDRAGPIAAQDAKTFQQQALTNQAVINENEQLSAQLQTQVNLANVDPINKLALQNDAQNFRLTELQQQQANQLGLTEFDYANRLQLANLSQDFRLTELEQQEQIQSGLSEQAYIQQKALQSDDFANRLELQETQNTFNEVQNLANQDQQRVLAQFQADHQSFLQTNADAAAFTRGQLAIIGNIMADPNIPNSEVNNRINFLNTQISFMQNGQGALAA